MNSSKHSTNSEWEPATTDHGSDPEEQMINAVEDKVLDLYHDTPNKQTEETMENLLFLISAIRLGSPREQALVCSGIHELVHQYNNHIQQIQSLDKTINDNKEHGLGHPQPHRQITAFTDWEQECISGISSENPTWIQDKKMKID